MTFSHRFDIRRAALMLGLGLTTLLAVSSAQTVRTAPVGVVMVPIAGGTVAAPGLTAVSLPLLDTPLASGAKRGRVESISGAVVTVRSAGWTSGALATTAAPYAVRLTSGAAQGRLYDVVANGADTLSLATTSGVLDGVVAGDSFELVPLDTLTTFFGADTLMGATSAAAADQVILYSGGTTLAYYYNTSLGRWVRTTGATVDRGNTVLRPDRGLVIARKSSAFNLQISGRAPVNSYRSTVPAGTVTLLAAGFPVDSTLAALNLPTALPGWKTGATADVADRLSILSGGTWVTYYHNGTNWRRSTGPTTNRDATLVNAGTAVLLERVAATPASGEYVRAVPYSW